VYRLPALARALGQADFVVVVLPLTDGTARPPGRAGAAAMRPTAWLFNIGRGAVVDETALVTALRERRIGGASSTCSHSQPLPAEHPLWGSTTSC